MKGDFYPNSSPNKDLESKFKKDPLKMLLMRKVAISSFLDKFK